MIQELQTKEHIEYFLRKNEIDKFISSLKEGNKFKEYYVTSINGACSTFTTEDKKLSAFHNGSKVVDHIQFSKLSKRQLIKMFIKTGHLSLYEYKKYKVLK